MRRIVERLTWRRARSTWSNYVDCNTYEEADRERKKRFILRAAASVNRSCVWDLGCNTGEYSRAVSEYADLVVAVDADHLAVEHLYHALKTEQDSTIFPLVGNLTDPSPGLGWRHRERQTLDARSRPDLILALALIHHLGDRTERNRSRSWSHGSRVSRPTSSLSLLRPRMPWWSSS